MRGRWNRRTENDQRHTEEIWLSINQNRVGSELGEVNAIAAIGLVRSTIRGTVKSALLDSTASDAGSRSGAVRKCSR